jgi:[acyl-carrier-protein] S-malonyltransferase
MREEGSSLMPARTAAMFPGQGITPREVDRAELADAVPELLELLDQLAGEDAFAMESWPTSIAQPAVFCASYARWTRTRSTLTPDYVVGHSMGELTALAAVEAIEPHEAFGLVAARGRLTEAAVRESGTGMLAISAPVAEAERIARSVGAVVANDNSPHQVVLSGELDRLRDLLAHAREQGLRATLLAVEGGFHSPWMQAAVEPFMAELERATFREPSVPMLSCITCEPLGDPVDELVRALTEPVRWRELVLELARRGVESFVDVGPGRVLEKLARRTLKEPASAPS